MGRTNSEKHIIMETTIKYSIIIPHKNIPNLLERCIKSIPNIPEIEIIVVDDNSNTTSLNQLEEFEKTYNNTKFIYTKKGLGAGFARNIGLQYIHGVWTIFADADDFFDNNFVDIINSHYSDKYDIIYFTSRSVDNETLSPIPSRVDISKKIRNGKIQELRYTYYVPWGKMIKSSFIKENSLTFDEVLASNDVYFSVACGIKAKKIYAYPQCIYVSTMRKNSLFFHDTIEKLDAKIGVSKRVNLLYRKYKLYTYRYNRFELVKKYNKLSKQHYKAELKSFFKEEPLYGILLDILRYYKSLLISKFI